MSRTLPTGIALAFIVAAAIWASVAEPAVPSHHLVILGAAAAAYMALNVGANDVANNMGPAVGAKALKMGTALLIAAVFDVAGALFAGQNVISTVSKELIDLNASLAPQSLILVMISATLAGAIWINASTILGTPVSTTHAVVGGIIGAAIAAEGTAAIAWNTVAIIAVSWTISPVIGAILAATLHAFIRRQITRRADKIAAARLWVPILIGAMAGIFAVYLRALDQRSEPDISQTLSIGAGFAVVTWLIATPWVRMRSSKLENRKKQVARLFRAPLVGAAALLSFAHGANDVSNAVAPLAAIMAALPFTPDYSDTLVPVWIMAIGALGIGLGILMFGPRVIHTVGEQITKLNEIRAFCVALSAAITVLAASAFGLPISSTYVAVGAVFGVGFLREYLAIRNMNGAAIPIRAQFVDASLLSATPEQAIARERKNERRFLVRRLNILRITAAWLVTLPVSATLAALIYGILSWLTLQSA